MKYLRIYLKTVNKDEVPNYLSKDITMVTNLAKVLFGGRNECSLRRVQVMLGAYINPNERPDIAFLCSKTDTGVLTMEDNRHEVNAGLFRDYLRDGDDLDEWENAMTSADLEMGQSEETEATRDDLESLFGSVTSSDREDE